MNATEAMERIEGHAFSAKVNLASNFPTFLRILTSQPEVRALAVEMNTDRVALDLSARIADLAASTVEGDYEHPADAALAAYLWLLSAKDGDSCDRATDTILNCKQCWWARKMAEHVRNASRFHTGAEEREKVSGS